MPTAAPADALDPDPPLFACTVSTHGLEAAWVFTNGEVDIATAPILADSLATALESARLLVLDLRGMTFLDAVGLRVIVDAGRRAGRAGRRLVVVQGPPNVDMVFEVTGTEGAFELLRTRRPRPARAEHHDAEPRIRPLDNPVNARVATARVMAVPDRQLWLHGADDVVQRAWAPREAGRDVAPGAWVDVYLDAEGAVNGWWDRASGLAINQRHLDHGAAPADGDPMACQGPCGVVWNAPAAAQLERHGERCLTCAGALAPG